MRLIFSASEWVADYNWFRYLPALCTQLIISFSMASNAWILSNGLCDIFLNSTITIERSEWKPIAQSWMKSPLQLSIQSQFRIGLTFRTLTAAIFFIFSEFEHKQSARFIWHSKSQKKNEMMCCNYDWARKYMIVNWPLYFVRLIWFRYICRRLIEPNLCIVYLRYTWTVSDCIGSAIFANNNESRWVLDDA